MSSFFDLSFDVPKSDRPLMECYPALVTFFDRNERFSADDFVCAAHLVYAWMPRILRLHRSTNEDFERGAETVRRARAEGVIGDPDLTWLVESLDNSLVAVSKLLHFARPDRFAIWDSRVHHFLRKASRTLLPDCVPQTWRDPRKLATYRAYLALLDGLTAADEFAQLHQRVTDALGHRVTPYRAAELVMYRHGADHMNAQEAH